jgi:prolipoprotein diacylglyceryltransferase
MYKPEEYLADPINFLKVWQGLSSFGGFVVCVPLAFYFFK